MSLGTRSSPIEKVIRWVEKNNDGSLTHYINHSSPLSPTDNQVITDWTGKPYRIFHYSVANTIPNQPTEKGILINIPCDDKAEANSKVYQLWLSSEDNKLFCRTGTASTISSQEFESIVVDDATEEIKGKVQLCNDATLEPDNTTKAATPKAVAIYLRYYGRRPNDIGKVGRLGFGVGFPDATEDELGELGLSPMQGTYDRTSDNYGNFMSDNGGVFVYIPHHYIRYGNESDDDYDIYGANTLSVKDHYEFNSEHEANQAGYFSPRAFYDGSDTVNQEGFFIQKYEPYAKTVGGIIYPYGDGSARGMVSITPVEMMNRAKNLGENYFVASYFMHQVTDCVSLLQGQHAPGTANCAWWQSRGGANYPPKGWNAATPQMYSHNGQKNGVMMTNGYSWEFCLGVTTPGTAADQAQTIVTSNKIYFLKPSVRVRDLTNGFDGETDAWSTVDNIENLYDIFYTDDNFLLTVSRTWYWGNGSNQMYIQPISRRGDRAVLDINAVSAFMLIPDHELSVNSAAHAQLGPSMSYSSPVTQCMALFIHGENVNSGSTVQSTLSRSFAYTRASNSSFTSGTFRCGLYLH